MKKILDIDKFVQENTDKNEKIYWTGKYIPDNTLCFKHIIAMLLGIMILLWSIYNMYLIPKDIQLQSKIFHIMVNFPFSGIGIFLILYPFTGNLVIIYAITDKRCISIRLFKKEKFIVSIAKRDIKMLETVIKENQIGSLYFVQYHYSDHKGNMLTKKIGFENICNVPYVKNIVKNSLKIDEEKNFIHTS